MRFIDVDKYADNQAVYLSEEEKQELINKARRLLNLKRSPYASKEQKQELDNWIHELDGQGIYIARDWPGHWGEWFFPDYDDALLMEEHEFAMLD